MPHRLLQGEIQKSTNFNFDEVSGPPGCNAVSLSCEMVGTSHSMTHYHITVDMNIQQHLYENLRSFVDQWH